MKNKLWKILLPFSFLLLTLLLFTHFYVPRFIVEIKNPLIEMAQADLKTSRNENNGKKIRFFSRDSLAMIAQLNYAETQPAKGSIIFIHGIRSSKEQYVELCKKMNILGYNTIAVDLRAHGESQGTYCTFGYKEKYDLSKLIDALNTNEHIHENIGIWAHSLGASIGLQAMAIDQRIQFGIIESAYSDFSRVTKDYTERYLHFEFDWLNDYMDERAGELAGFDPKQVNPKDFCKKITQPVLLVHGDKDEKINIKYARENFNNLKSQDKTFIRIKGAGHNNLWLVGGEKYGNQVLAFIDKNCQEKD